MPTHIYIIFSLIIHFGIPGISEKKKSIINNSTQNRIITGFPYQYFEGEVLTDEMVEDRIRRIYIPAMMAMIGTSSVGLTVDPIVEQTRFPSTSTERLIPNQLDFQSNIEIRGGEYDNIRLISMINWVAERENIP